VVLKIRRRKFQRTPQKGEIVITRRLFRTGESEYLLNGKLCRLRDIQDIFMGTGLGPESYAIIGQERIGQLLSSKPHDRRAIIEEAAGITRFKNKKRLAELRLESAKQNLARVDDIFEEVTRQMNSLKRQAAKAERFAAVRDELRGRLRVVLASRMALMDADQARAGGRRSPPDGADQRFGGGDRSAGGQPARRSPSGATNWTARARRRRTGPTKRPSSWSGPRRGSAPTPSAWRVGDAHCGGRRELEQTRTQLADRRGADAAAFIS
jgi:chromosome segregation protein